MSQRIVDELSTAIYRALPAKLTYDQKIAVDLAARAKAAAGGSAELARLFGASKQAASEWGRVRSIPRHLRPRLEEFVRQRSPADAGREHAKIAERREDEKPWESLGSLTAGTRLKLAPPSSETEAASVTRAWHTMAKKHKDRIREYVSRAAVIAIAIEHALPPDSARKVIAELSAEIGVAVNREIIRSG